MNNQFDNDAFEVLDANEAFFAPTSSDAIDLLVGQFNGELSALHRAASLTTEPEFASSMFYFLDGNSDKDTRYSMQGLAGSLFKIERAILSLTELYWRKAISLTNVYDFMPQKRREEWETTLTTWRADRSRHQDQLQPMPAFEAETVRTSLYSLLDMRPQFLAEKVDGVFRNLSVEHLTNQPEGFSKRIIMWYSYNTELSYADYRKCGHLNDLRSVIAKFMGNDEIPHYDTTSLITDLAKNNRFGEWVSLDGNALRIKIFMKGTAHLEVHPDIAYRLNMILAQMHPLAIPSEFRQKPSRNLTKSFGLMQRPLPGSVLKMIYKIVGLDNKYKDKTLRAFSINVSDEDVSRFAIDEAISVLERLGGVVSEGVIRFDYDVCQVVRDELAYSRCVPETKSHQYYPTPKTLAQRVAELADIQPGESILEPSAGVGGLLDHLHVLERQKVTCVEVAKLHCEVLAKKGFSEVVCDDFLRFATGTNRKWDCIVMNPPFSDGRAMAHVNAAAKLLIEGGRLVAILPDSVRNKIAGAGLHVSYSDTIHNAFPGVSVAVVIVSIFKMQMAMAA